MRMIVSMSGLIVSLSLIVLVHTMIVNCHIRDVEVTTGLASACDYAMDEMQDMFADLKFSAMSEDKAKEKIILSFCKSLQSVIGTDGEIHVKVISADLKTGSFDFVVEENFDYGFKGRKGHASCERAVRLER